MQNELQLYDLHGLIWVVATIHLDLYPVVSQYSVVSDFPDTGSDI